MTEKSKPPEKFRLNLNGLQLSMDSELNFLILVLASAVTLSAISLASIALKIGPISRQASTWNKCVETTTGFLSTVPGFRSAGDDGLTAMGVSLCNGSTPQRADNSSD